jgi:hypothetical protein
VTGQPSHEGPAAIWPRALGESREQTMDKTATMIRHEAIDPDGLLVHNWRTLQLRRLGIPVPLAEAAADHVDWHQVASLVRRGCPPELALRIVR